MKRLLALLLLVCVSVNVCAEAVLAIKGKARRITLRARKHGGAAVDEQGSSTMINLRPGRDFETIRLTFKVLADDEFSFSLAGNYSRDKKSKTKQYFEWEDCDLFRVGDKELIGPKAENSQTAEEKSKPEGESKEGEPSEAGNPGGGTEENGADGE